MKYLLHNCLTALKRPFSGASRKKRMGRFIELMEIRGGERVIDLGGAPGFWQDCPHPLHITIVNLPGYNAPDPGPSHHELVLMDGDACNVDGFEDMSFDIAFSNSVIEHVGDETKQAEMAREARRLAPRYWVQTPSIWFPIEAHNNMPFWWFWPKWLQRSTMRRWREKLPAWTEMVEETRVLLLKDLKRMFPDAAVWTERRFGFVKSYTMFRTSK